MILWNHVCNSSVQIMESGVRRQAQSQSTLSLVSSHLHWIFLYYLNSFFSGQQVKMASSKLWTQCVFVSDQTVLVTCFHHQQLVGHAFASVWSFNGGTSKHILWSLIAYIIAGVVRWITQLIIDMSIHKHYIATQLLQTLKVHPLFQSVNTVGLMSLHPAACNALAKYADHLYYNLCSWIL